ncbi:3-dehydroquinate synthase [Thermoflexibacter ruber]|uniref:3-dehydroquinate synthase n=1 Tax=Thermoflexibacter ruber TaxID=1003 RepID=A0A1I2G195_9BACT|nr:3-dehydroquinate synthase [Thermoflexibacter ruber]SFF10909.1 3-dehydroquinate synthase [Thermoflexibacter ruber]
MSVILQSFTVKFEYKTYFTENVFSIDNELFKQVIAEDGSQGKRKLFFIIDDGVAQAHPYLPTQIEQYCHQYHAVLDLRGEIWIVQGGEAVKNSDIEVKKILQAVNDYGICRHSYIVAIGGGAVLDMVGFAAAIAHRGVKHIRIPTTVLSQNDSGVGVKNGINTFGKKNFTGTFKPPQAVINDASFLTTLHIRDWRAGISEAIKVALIKDKTFFDQIVADVPLLNHRNMEAMRKLIYRCAEMHIQHIAGGDPFEMGSSRPLDFGHWSAHKLEQLTHHQIKHGEAVAIGIALDTTYSFLKGLLTEAEWKQVIHLLKDLGFEVYHPALDLVVHGEHLIIKGLQEFREHLGGELTIMLLERLGKGLEVHSIDTETMIKAINYLSSL